MAQTITVSKTNTSFTLNGTTDATLLTAPAGTASRVIVNALAFNRTDGGSSNPYIMMRLYNATTGYVPIMFINAMGITDALAFLPSNMSGTSSIGVGTDARATTFLYYSDNAGTTPLGDRNPNLTKIATSPGITTGCYVPAQFWMSSGDTLVVKATWGNGPGTCQANFTIITES
jgi:hypothetical protein